MPNGAEDFGWQNELGVVVVKLQAFVASLPQGFLQSHHPSLRGVWGGREWISAGGGLGSLSLVIPCQADVRGRGLGPGDAPGWGMGLPACDGSLNPASAYTTAPSQRPSPGVIRLPSEIGWGEGACRRRQLLVLKSKAEKQMTAPRNPTGLRCRR